MTKHYTSKELLYAWKVDRKPIWSNVEGWEVWKYIDCSEYEKRDQLEDFINYPSAYTLTDPNKKNCGYCGEPEDGHDCGGNEVERWRFIPSNELKDLLPIPFWVVDYFKGGAYFHTPSYSDYYHIVVDDNSEPLRPYRVLMEPGDTLVKHVGGVVRVEKPVTTPQVGQPLTLEQLHDVEFMRGVSRVKINTPHSRDTYRLVKSYSWGGGDIQNIEYAITHADVGWTVTVTEVVEGA